MIYVDNAATTKMSRVAIETQLACMTNTFANPSSLHGMGQEAAEVLESARGDIARHINADAKEIIFTSGGSESDNQAILSAAMAGERAGKKHIVSTAIEHHAVLHTLDKLEKRGFDITLVPVHENGIVVFDEIVAALREDTCLVSVMYANNEIGTIQPIAEIGALCREKEILFHTDAVQAVGHVPIDVKALKIDLLSLSAHKFHGPKGVGALYARRGIRLTNLIEGGAQEGGKHAGTQDVPSILSMAAALEESCTQMESRNFKLIELRDLLIAGLQQIPHSVLNGDVTRRLSGNVSFCFEGIEGESMLLMLSERGIYASSGSACTSGSLEPSHVLLAIGRPHEVAHGSLRLTLSHENTHEEIHQIIQAVTEVVSTLRGMSPLWRDLQEGKREHVL
ncbi:MAG: cysteine desulfurase [Lachnospiraceae bacterium]|jgi:cysteine desulfurase|nr:cysteine desulfurase [Lachnospiraceae bacterium]